MQIAFSKYQGAGNDFIIIDDSGGSFPEDDHVLIQKMCDRHFGVGADGLMLLRPSGSCDFKMIYYNSDGHEGTMCGNGGRCMVVFARDIGRIDPEKEIIFQAVDGEHRAVFTTPNAVSLKMQNVKGLNKMGSGYAVNTGSLHHVEYVDKLADVDVYRSGRAIREHEMYAPEGCNVNFIEMVDVHTLMIRTYERGVENETLACGTGSVAAAIVHHAVGHISKSYTLHARGGDLRVSFEIREGHYENIWLEGPAYFVFNGVIDR